MATWRYYGVLRAERWLLGKHYDEYDVFLVQGYVIVVGKWVNGVMQALES